MSEDKEQEIRIQFLTEAEDYLQIIESELLGLSNAGLKAQNLEATLRAAHSIKGGAAMMEFNTLSHFSHRLEDFFKVLHLGQIESIDEEVEMLLLSSIDCLRQIISFSRHGEEIEPSWLEINVEPIFDRLHTRLGEPEPEDDLAAIATDADAEIKVLLFQTEVEEYLQRLESALKDASLSALSSNLSSIAQELAGLSQMLKLDSLSSLCESIIQHIQTSPEQINRIARLALQEWRRIQTVIVSGQVATIPTQLNLDEGQIVDRETTKFNVTASEQKLLTNTTADSLNWISSLENITSKEEKPATLSKREKSSESLLKNYGLTADNEVSDNSIRVSIRHLDSLNELLGEYTVERNTMSLRLKRMRRSLNLMQQKIQLLNELKILHRREIRDVYNPVATPAISSSVKVSQTIQGNNYRWRTNDDFREITQDSGNSQQMSPEALDIIEQIEKITSDLTHNLEEAEFTSNAFTRNSEMMQTKLNQIRMRPLAELVAPFPRALRNLELQYGKKAQLKIRGSSTLIDRTIIESLKNPLIQLLRNAFAHGIEEPSLRRAKGKPEQGTITINASYRGDRIAIAVKDDGRGIDIEKIRLKAEQKGLIAPNSDNIKDIDLLQLIFTSGFTTAEELTDLAGRGMGMDVVKTNLEQIGGTIEVDTLAGVGTTFTIAVPFKLSVLRVLLIESNGMMLAFPSNVVEEMSIVEPEKIFTRGGQEFFNLEGSIVPLLKLDRCLKLHQSSQILDTDELPSINQPTVLTIAQGNELFGIQTDRYWREEEVTIRQVEGHLPLPEGFCGCTLLGDGQIVPLVDVLALLKSINEPNPAMTGQSQPSSLAGRSTTAKNLPSNLKLNPDLLSTTKAKPSNNLHEQLKGKSEPPPPTADSALSIDRPSSLTTKNTHNNTIMIVDDSLNARRFLALTLEQAGYRIEQARDGQEALEKLAAGVSVYVIICDLEMPRLDGFGFLSQVKSNSKYKHLPVIMLTSRSGEKHRQAAMNLGAKAYMNKPFKKQELWNLLAQLSS